MACMWAGSWTLIIPVVPGKPDYFFTTSPLFSVAFSAFCGTHFCRIYVILSTRKVVVCDF